MMGHNQSGLVEELKSAPSLCRIEDVLIGIINFRALTLKMVSKKKKLSAASINEVIALGSAPYKLVFIDGKLIEMENCFSCCKLQTSDYFLESY